MKKYIKMRMTVTGALLLFFSFVQCEKKAANARKSIKIKMSNLLLKGTKLKKGVKTF